MEDNNRIPIILKYLKGFKESEIADILGININTIKSRLFKGRQKLKNVIVRLEGGESPKWTFEGNPADNNQRVHGTPGNGKE